MAQSFRLLHDFSAVCDPLAIVVVSVLPSVSILLVMVSGSSVVFETRAAPLGVVVTTGIGSVTVPISVTVPVVSPVDSVGNVVSSVTELSVIVLITVTTSSTGVDVSVILLLSSRRGSGGRFCGFMVVVSPPPCMVVVCIGAFVRFLKIGYLIVDVLTVVTSSKSSIGGFFVVS